MKKKRLWSRHKPVFHPVGEVFEHDGSLIKAVREDGTYCDSCYFLNKNCGEVQCLDNEREDATDVHFDEIQL